MPEATKSTVSTNQKATIAPIAPTERKRKFLKFKGIWEMATAMKLNDSHAFETKKEGYQLMRRIKLLGGKGKFKATGEGFTVTRIK